MAIKRKYGWKPDLADHRDVRMKLASPTLLKALPPIIDLRAMMPPVFDQGDLGSCTANATAAQIWAVDKTDPCEPSRLFIYYNTRILEGTTTYDSGASIRNSIRSVVKYGFVPDIAWPYIPTRFKQKPPVTAYKAATKDKVTQYMRLSQSPAGIKGALFQGFTVNFGFTVYPSFESVEVTNGGMMPMPKIKEKVLGGHAVLIVGYNDEINRYIVRNSWGAHWGDAGYFYMPYEFVHNNDYCDDFWTIKAVP
jgi:C1A family cysteine protease